MKRCLHKEMKFSKYFLNKIKESNSLVFTAIDLVFQGKSCMKFYLVSSPLMTNLGLNACDSLLLLEYRHHNHPPMNFPKVVFIPKEI